ncbi:MAG TPA: substrate-binding domain-containing protein, partial [Oculatellaceae cyanobacterium]
LYRVGRRAAEDRIEQIEIPVGKGKRNQESLTQERQTEISSAGAVHREPVTVPSSITGLQPQPDRRIANVARSHPRPVEIPPTLPERQEIRGGRRGRYRVDRLIKEDGERVRLYEGTQLLNSKSVLIKEYLLPDRDFNQREARERKEQFGHLASLNLKNGGVQDFRLLSPWDAIAPQHERRCYLITEHYPNISSSLREYLAKTGSMPPKQVRQVLNQVLQTLWFLHNHKLRLSTGEVQQGLAHGNLSLDSLLIATSDQLSVSDEPQFLIYVSDLALWEHLFNPPTAKTVNPSFAQDLIALGYVSFYLLSGGTVDRVSGQPLDPKIEQQWPYTNDGALKQFIQRLIRLDGSFKSAEEAREELLRLPPERQIDEAAIPTELDEQKANDTRFFRLLLSILALGFLMGFTWGMMGLLGRWLPKTAPLPIGRSLDKNPYGCCIKDVTDVPTGNFIYTAAESERTWSYVLRETSLVSYGKSLEKELSDRQIKFKLNYQPVSSVDDAIQQVQNNEATFLITRLVGNLADGLKQKNLTADPIGYEGIVVFVAFSDAQREGSLPQALNGKISFEQLRKLYTGEIENWKKLDGTTDLPVELYVPKEPEVLRLFEQLVFKGNQQQVDKFRDLIQQKRIKQEETLKTFGYINTSFEKEDSREKKGAIGFGLLSKVFGQCSVYPLAVGEENHEVQALVQDNGKSIEPTTDLCDDKGSYWSNVKVFENKEYPWGYSLAVVYPKPVGNSSPSAGGKFAEILKTDEGQRLLSEAGLVPLHQEKNDR